MRRAIVRTGEYLKVRHAFGEPLINNQYLRFRLAELAAEVDILHLQPDPLAAADPGVEQ